MNKKTIIKELASIHRDMGELRLIDVDDYYEIYKRLGSLVSEAKK